MNKDTFVDILNGLGLSDKHSGKVNGDELLGLVQRLRIAESLIDKASVYLDGLVSSDTHDPKTTVALRNELEDFIGKTRDMIVERDSSDPSKLNITFKIPISAVSSTSSKDNGPIVLKHSALRDLKSSVLDCVKGLEKKHGRREASNKSLDTSVSPEVKIYQDKIVNLIRKRWIAGGKLNPMDESVLMEELDNIYKGLSTSDQNYIDIHLANLLGL